MDTNTSSASPSGLEWRQGNPGPGTGFALPTPKRPPPQRSQLSGNFNFLAPMLGVHCGHDKERDLLKKQYPWLHELTKFEQPSSLETDFKESRKAFKCDSHLFMIALRRFTLAERSLELYFNFVEDRLYGAQAQHLLFRLWERQEKTSSFPSQGNWSRWTETQVSFKDTYITEDKHCRWATQMVKGRRGKGKADTDGLRKRFDTSYFEMHKDEIFKSFHSNFPTDTNKFEGWLEKFNERYWVVRKTDIDEVAFCVSDTGGAWASPLWLRIGRNLSYLAQLLGVRVERWTYLDTGSPGIINAFGVTAHLQRTEWGQVQSRIQEQEDIIRRQERAITALRFRHLLENLPGPEFKGKATGKWQDFWEQAVEAAWKSRTSSPDSHGPMNKLLEKEFAKIDNNPDLTNDNSKLSELMNEHIPERGMALYRMLSREIHHYEDGKFIVHTHIFTQDDIDILNTLIPDNDNIVDGEVDWSKERKRYLLQTNGDDDDTKDEDEEAMKGICPPITFSDD